jgi:hypothetical protein
MKIHYDDEDASEEVSTAFHEPHSEYNVNSSLFLHRSIDNSNLPKLRQSMQVEFSFRDKANNFKYQQPLTRLVKPLNHDMSDYSEDTRNSLGITFGDKSKKSRNSL